MAKQFNLSADKKLPKGKAGKPMSPQKGVSQFGLPKAKRKKVADKTAAEMKDEGLA